MLYRRCRGTSLIGQRMTGSRLTAAPPQHCASCRRLTHQRRLPMGGHGSRATAVREHSSIMAAGPRTVHTTPGRLTSSSRSCRVAAGSRLYLDSHALDCLLGAYLTLGPMSRPTRGGPRCKARISIGKRPISCRVACIRSLRVQVRTCMVGHGSTAMRRLNTASCRGRDRSRKMLRPGYLRRRLRTLRLRLPLCASSQWRWASRCAVFHSCLRRACDAMRAQPTWSAVKFSSSLLLPSALCPLDILSSCHLTQLCRMGSDA